jgi:ABC-type lipoprotein export system ATPase subunit
VARAIVANPLAILAVEPTGNLHSPQSAEIMEMRTKLNQDGATIARVTHSEAGAALAHRSVRLAGGWIEQQ